MNIRRFALLIIDTAILAMSYILCYGVFSLSSESYYTLTLRNYIFNFLFVLVCVISVRVSFKVYYNVWRYSNIRAYLLIIFSDFIGASIAMLMTSFLFEFAYLNIMIVFINVVTSTLVTLISRFLYQHYVNRKNYISSSYIKINVAIVGAGKTGSLLADELLYNTNSKYRPICFVDVSKDRIGAYINGIKVIDANNNVLEKLNRLNVKEIFIALPSLSTNEAKKLYDFYSKNGCKIKLYDFALGETSEGFNAKRKLRDLKIEDLLFRESLDINNSKTYDFYKDKVVLVTGGGGSIGSEICRLMARAKPSKLVVFDIYENNAYDLQQELYQIYGDKLDLCIEIGSVRDIKRLDDVFARHKPDVVFHAAAHKHVPLMEESCCEAIKNNVFGTYNTVQIAEKHSVKRFIMISTDKAVNPTNVMGASKRLCEMIVLSRHDSKITEFAAVRFGNVLGSNGSVVPLFQRQIAAGGPVTITDRRIIRYFMTIREASQLVLQAGAMATNGELFVLDMGKPVRIIELAENVIKLAGYTPYHDIDIVETGLRPGEKLYEELLIKSEELGKTENDLIFTEKEKPFSHDDIDNKINELSKVIDNGNDEIKAVLKKIVPTYHNPDEVNKNALESDEMKKIYKKPTVSKHN